MGAMASSFCGASGTKPSKGVFGTQSYIRDGVFAKKLTVLSIFEKKTRCPTGVQICRRENATFKQIIRNFP